MSPGTDLVPLFKTLREDEEEDADEVDRTAASTTDKAGRATSTDKRLRLFYVECGSFEVVEGAQASTRMRRIVSAGDVISQGDTLRARCAGSDAKDCADAKDCENGAYVWGIGTAALRAYYARFLSFLKVPSSPFSRLGAEDLRRLSYMCKEVRYENGSLLIKKGELISNAIQLVGLGEVLISGGEIRDVQAMFNHGKQERSSGVEDVPVDVDAVMASL